MAKSLFLHYLTRSHAIAWFMIMSCIISVISTAQAESDTHNPALGKHMPDILINKNVSAGVVGGRWRMRFDYSHFNYDGDNSHYNTNSYNHDLVSKKNGDINCVNQKKTLTLHSLRNRGMI